MLIMSTIHICCVIIVGVVPSARYLDERLSSPVARRGGESARVPRGAARMCQPWAAEMYRVMAHAPVRVMMRHNPADHERKARARSGTEMTKLRGARGELLKVSKSPASIARGISTRHRRTSFGVVIKLMSLRCI